MISVGDIRDMPGSQNSLAIISLARFAVEEHNKKENSLLEFERVISAKHQSVAGFMYYITLEAKDGVNKKVYKAKVWDVFWMYFKELLEFKLVDDASAESSA
ncbi:cysteine proteinase inhibitor-like [Cicer arietinum]|uniref:Cysteine proteinase inhibitor n=1 Tax=Cicer arietinum TaxID=3827 RepID=A0A1S3EG69_CICAR|nr:cysteine proteinase inhibitor-like [Cicer arietinum]